jgi:hypothetical protein|nr:MAG TPA: hypothetical protein [Caudoviricetes sp.]
MTKDDYMVSKIKEAVAGKIANEVEEEIEAWTTKFHKLLVDNKDKYISEVMNGIRVFTEQNNPEMCLRYKIEFENIYRLEANK